MDPSNHGARKVYHGVRKVYHGVRKISTLQSLKGHEEKCAMKKKQMSEQLELKIEMIEI